MVADSVSRALIYPRLENPTNSLIKQVNGYSSVYDKRALKPDQNVSQVVRQELAGAEFDAVILGAPTVDITNQDVSAGVTEKNVAETEASSIAMVKAAEFAVKSGRARQVVLLPHPPRYDTVAADPHGVRPLLAKLANTALHNARDNSDFTDSITVGVHSGLECQGHTRDQLYTNDRTNRRNRSVRMGKNDGIHLYSQAGAAALTSSTLRILQEAGLGRRPREEPRPARQEEQFTAARGGRSRAARRHEGPVWQVPTYNRFQGFL
jgi:hypothetical protein